MKDQIKKLANKIWEEEYWNNQNTDKLLPIQLNRFAELIVRECIKIAYRNDVAKFTKDGYAIGMDIGKYFGVE